MIWNCGHASFILSTLRPPHAHHTARTQNPRRKKRREKKGKKNKSRKITYAKTDLLPLSAPLPSHAFVYARRAPRVKGNGEGEDPGGSGLHWAKCATSLPPTDLLESRVDVTSVHHVVDSCIKSGFPRSRGLGLLGWGYQNFFLFLHVILGHCRCCLVFPFAVLLRSKLFGCLGFGLR